MVTMIPFALDITKTLSLLPSSHLVPGKRKLGFSIDDIVGEDKNTVQEGKICQSNGRLNSSSQLPSSHRSTNDDVNRFTPPPIAHHHQPSHRSCPQAPSSAPPRVGIARSSPSPPISRSPNGSRSASSSSCAPNTTSKHHSPASQIKSESRSVSPTATHLLHSNKNIASISSPSSNVPQTIDSPSFNLHHHHPSQPPLPPPHPPISHQAHPHPFQPHPTQAPPQPSPHHQATLHPALSPHQHVHSHPHPNHLEANKVLQHPASLACNPQEAFAAAFSSNYFALSSRLPIEYRSPYHQWFLARHSPLALQTPYPGSPITPFMFFNRKPKRVRTAFSPTQLMELETAFDKNNYVIGNERKELAKKLGLNETQVKVWFQNRRTKQKRQKQEEDDGTYQVSNSDNRGEADDSECMSDIEDEEDTEMYNGTGNTYHHQQDSSPKAVNSSPNSHR